MTRNKFIFAAAILILFFLYHFATNPVGIPSTEIIRAEEDPNQKEVSAETIRIHSSGYDWTLTPKAEYHIAARVLGQERYFTGWQASVSPVDLALGWGKLRDREVDRWISWSQSGRWYFYNYSGNSQYSQDFITSHSANVHIIPATKNLKNAVLRLSGNDLVALEGYLVNANVRKGSSTHWWNSSLTRTDTGDGSCELLYLTKLTMHRKDYR
jgi:hypothetical protein